MNVGRFIFVLTTLFLGAMLMIPLESFQLPKGKDPVSIGEFVYTVPINKEISPEQAGTEWYYQFLEPTVNDSIFAPLLERVRNKTLQVYSPEYPFTKVMDPDSAIQRIDVPYPIEVVGENGWEDVRIDTVWEKKQAGEVIGVTFHEEWFYDAASLTLTKKVLGIIPIIRYSMDYNLFYKNEFSVFYIPFSDGEVKGRSVEVYGLISDFRDSVYLNNSAWYCPLQNNQSKLNVQAQSRVKLLTSLKDRVKQKNTDVYSHKFPFAMKLNKQEKADVISYVDSASIMHFREDWKVDLNNMRFVKTVCGFSLGYEQVVTTPVGEPGDDNYHTLSVNAPMMLGYFSMNNSQTSESNFPKSIFIPAFSYAVNYQTTGNAQVNLLHTQDSLRITEVAKDMHDRARSGRMEIYGRKDNYFSYDPWLRNEQPLQKDEVFSRFTDKYTTLVEDVDGNYHDQDIFQERPYEDDCGFRFYEQWKFDARGMTFTKNIVGIALTHFLVSGNDELIDASSTFFIYNNPVGRRDSIIQTKYLIGRNIISPVLINSNEAIANEDDMGRPIYDYYVTPEENIEASRRYQFVQQVIEGVFAGTIDAYHPANPQRKLGTAEFRAMIDSTAKHNSVVHLPGREFYIFNELQFNEDWYYNAVTGEMAKVVNAITFTHHIGRSWLLEPSPFPKATEGFVIRLNSGNIR